MKSRSGLLVISMSAVAAPLLVFACSSSGVPPAGLDQGMKEPPVITRTGDGGSKDSALDLYVPDAGPCTPLPLTGQLINQQYVNGTAPPPQGGTIVDGIYVLTAASDYQIGMTGDTGFFLRTTVLLQGNELRITEYEKNMGTITLDATYQIVTPDGGSTPNVLNCNLVCTSDNPDGGGSLTFGYTISNGTLKLLKNNHIENVFLKQ